MIFATYATLNYARARARALPAARPTEPPRRAQLDPTPPPTPPSAPSPSSHPAPTLAPPPRQLPRGGEGADGVAGERAERAADAFHRPGRRQGGGRARDAAEGAARGCQEVPQRKSRASRRPLKRTPPPRAHSANGAAGRARPPLAPQGSYNVLVATSIGEEGLDIGEVDMIICFDALASATRTTQRYGRTGRKHDGRVVTLMTEGYEEAIHERGIERHKTMRKAIRHPGARADARHRRTAPSASAAAAPPPPHPAAAPPPPHGAPPPRWQATSTSSRAARSSTPRKACPSRNVTCGPRCAPAPTARPVWQVDGPTFPIRQPPRPRPSLYGRSTSPLPRRTCPRRAAASAARSPRI